jgi:redox-sensitive bicupin YhaK (pirin superfamily)
VSLKSNELSPSHAGSSAIFAIGSDSFVQGSPPPSTTPGISLPSAGEPAEQAIAYQRMHEACAALLIAAQQLTEHYGTAWRHWASTREDIARLKEEFGLK